MMAVVIITVTSSINIVITFVVTRAACVLVADLGHAGVRLR